MIKYLEHSQINKSKWDECIHNSSNKNIYANSWYLDIVSKDWEALVEDDYETVMPLTWNKKYGINYLYQPFFTQQLGIFSTKNNLSESKVNELLLAIPSKYRFMEINLNIDNSLSDKSFEMKQGITHLLKLNKTYEVIKNGYSDNLKRNINKANKSEIKIVKDINIDDLINLFRTNKGKEIDNLKDKDYELFKKLCNAIEQNATLNNIGVVNKDGTLIAAAIFPEYLNQSVFLFSGLADEGKEIGAMPFLIDSFIKENVEKKLTLDFEGSLNTNLARFYKSFGSDERIYPQIKRNLLPKPIKWLKK
jgi:hypothetical protein